MSEFDVPRKGRLHAVDVIPPDLTYTPHLDREEAIDFPNTALHKLILISKYRDNSILRDEELDNSAVAEVFVVVRLLTSSL